MIARIGALIVIFLGTTIAWAILGATLLTRTYNANVEQEAALGTLWGPSQTQTAPEVWYRAKFGSQSIALEGSDIAVDLALDQRRKGLLWYNTYRVAFLGRYRVRNDSPASRLSFSFPFPADKGIYDDVRLFVDGRPINNAAGSGQLDTTFILPHGKTAVISVSYASRGLGQWSYQFGSGIHVIRNFILRMHTNFNAIDFPAESMAPNDETRSSTGWDLVWRYRNLVTGYGIGMVFPERLQPGPLAQRITFWAPLSLLFYFFVMFVITTLRRIDLHPMNYFFLAGSFFSFHLLFAYTVDRISIWVAFALCSLVSMFLTVSYLRIVAGLRFAAVEAALAQFFYLILFSLALFNEGFSGLAITIGAIVTLFCMMQLTARINWGERFAAVKGSSIRS